MDELDMKNGQSRPSESIKVMASGVFDLLHPGHLYYLNQAKGLGSYLVVVVANNEVVTKSKGSPVFDANSRAMLVQSLKCVDEVIVPGESDRARYYQTVLDIAPDIIALGFDQEFDKDDLSKELANYGWNGQIVRLSAFPGEVYSSSQIKKSIKL